MDTANLVFTTHTLYYYMVSNYGNPRTLASPTWYATFPFHRKSNYTHSPLASRSLLAQLYVTCTSNLVVRCIFGRRAWSMTKQRILLTICVLVPMLTAVAAGFAFASLEWKTRTFAHFSNLSYLLFLGFGSGFVADGIIAVTLCVALWKSRTGFPRTDSIIKTLMLYTIKQGFSQGRLLFSYTNKASYASYLLLHLEQNVLEQSACNPNGQDRLHERAAAAGAANILEKQPGIQGASVCAQLELNQRWVFPPIIVDIHQSAVTSDLESQESSPDLASLKEQHAQE
ncbi:hypothetical protein BD779DRAFT_1802686 [Infundibulicybe gibba]|nr:hypothetical protein BD779DRAFT_1802686 [Infundibulicybe gibba]